MLITPIIELQLLDRFELIDRVHRAELQARNAELLLKLERDRVAAALGTEPRFHCEDPTVCRN